MVKYLIVHNKHEGCYDFQYYEDEAAKIRLTSITINPPKIFMFDDKEQAHDFFCEYINDVDVIDNRCKKKDDVEHIDYCTCGIIEMDEEENPILFYNKRNQIFFLENGPQVFIPPQELKNDISNMNLTNKLIRRCKNLGKEQRKRYIELGNICRECEPDEEEEEEENVVKKPEESNESKIIDKIIGNFASKIIENSEKSGTNNQQNIEIKLEIPELSKVKTVEKSHEKVVDKSVDKLVDKKVRKTKSKENDKELSDDNIKEKKKYTKKSKQEQ
jgi:hypothetical protein